ncbi:MAG: TIGR03085 family metal-binding protein [Acidimicrobiales bacterium]|nr:TIGR03085 family metal-binding protein [Acidimicrobiales bacterium]
MPEPLDARERRELCDLFGDLGPSAPTLCEGWATLDLAAHLVVRERSPLAAPGILFGGPFERVLERATGKAVARGYDHLVEQVRNGPPLGPFAVPVIRGIVNLNEYAVHHEDVRRANGLRPRTDRADLQAALWRLLRRGAGLQLRRVDGATVRLTSPASGDRAVDHVVVGRTGPEVTLTGAPLELVLYLFGRRRAAQVDVTGAPEARAILAQARLGI